MSYYSLRLVNILLKSGVVFIECVSTKRDVCYTGVVIAITLTATLTITPLRHRVTVATIRWATYILWWSVVVVATIVEVTLA